MVYVSVSQQLGLDAGGTPLEMLLLSGERRQALGRPSAGWTSLAQVPEASLSPAHTNHSGAGGCSSALGVPLLLSLQRSAPTVTPVVAHCPPWLVLWEMLV